jgi:penicillin-insensitive murein endopeptidase
LPRAGKNFSAYSVVGVALGRTYVHAKVADIVLAAYHALERSAQGKTFIYGETGWSAGGRIRPHRTHRNGLSVDFMVPVIDDSGRTAVLPAGAGNRFGYDIDFDADAKYENLSIDFDAIAEHLYQLDLAAKARGAGIALVIFDPPYLPRLLRTPRGAHLRANIHFLQGRAWIRHDEHYHVDFATACNPL